MAIREWQERKENIDQARSRLGIDLEIDGILVEPVDVGFMSTSSSEAISAA